MRATTVYRLVAVAMLAGMGLHRFATARAPQGMGEYSARVRASADRVPRRVAGWVGEDVPVPPQAIKVLDPNLIVSRRYLNVETGASAGLLLVHCTDAHDMVGHFPLRCYPAQGWDLQAQQPRDWESAGLRVAGTEYRFVRDEVVGGTARQTALVVVNCLLRPGGQMFRDMDGLSGSIMGAGGQSSGAAQLQVYFDAGVPQDQRDRAVEALVAGYRPVLDAILANLSR